MDPVIKFAKDAPKELNVPAPSTSSAAATPSAMAAAMAQDAEMSIPKGGPYKGKNKIKNKKSKNKDDQGQKDDSTTTAEKRNIDAVPAHLYQSVPKKIKIENLRKLAFIAQIKKDKSFKKCCDALVKFLPVAEIVK